MSVKRLLEEWKELKDALTPFPWYRPADELKNGEYRVYSSKNYRGVCCPTASAPHRKASDSKFIASAPQNYDLAMQALEKTEEALRVAIGPLEMMQEKFKDMGAKDYSILAEALKNAFKGVLKKHGFEEEIE